MIAVDWGTSSLRAYRIDAGGATVDRRSAAAGLLSCRGDFEAVLARHLAGWDDETILMAGMVGSRSGWREAPYADCPAGIAEIAAAMVEVEAPSFAGRRILIAPGVCRRGGDTPPEVMRGEETQILGLVDRLPGAGPHTLCLPGTHSKWVRVDDGRIVAFSTAMTGEVYALMRRHSLLAALMPDAAAADADTDDADAFARGVAGAGRAGGLLNHLFGVRTQGLFGALDAAAAPSYLSGLLVGHELRDQLPVDCACVHLIGGDALVRRYERALAVGGVAVVRHPESSTADGLVALATALGLPR